MTEEVYQFEYVREFCHSGDIGDIIYSLPTIRAAGSGRLVLYDHPGRTAHGMTAEKVDRIKPLLELQPYIHSVVWREGIHNHNLNGFRDHAGHGVLTDMHLATHGFDWRYRKRAWIKVDKVLPVAPVLVHWAPRYENANFPWEQIVPEYGIDNVAFVGNVAEHEEFRRRFGDINRVDLRGLLRLAQAIAGSELFIGSQSSPLSIAHAMKHKVVMCISPGGSQQHCVFQRMNCIIGWDGKIEWPELSI